MASDSREITACIVDIETGTVLRIPSTDYVQMRLVK